MNKLLQALFLLFCLAPLQNFAQDDDVIILDRPDITESPYLVPKNYFQMENGIAMNNLGNGKRNFTLPTSLWKFGLTDNFELRLITDFNSDFDNNQYGLNPVWIGFKAPLIQPKGKLIPKVSIIAHLQIPNWSSEHLKANYVAPQFRFVFQHDVSERVSFSYNLGMEWDGYSPAPKYIYTVAPGISLTDKLGMYVELFGDIKNFNTQGNHSFDGGFTYLLNRNSIVDISAGYQYIGAVSSSFISCGYSFRFKVK